MKRKYKILVVDDTEINVELLTDILKEFRYDVLSANDGMEALAVVQTHKPDLILLDISMPRMDGYETCVQLKSKTETEWIPIIIVTALQDLPSKIKAIESGADDFIAKPFNKIDLKARVKSLLRIVDLRESILERNREIQLLSAMRNEVTHTLVHSLQTQLAGTMAITEKMLKQTDTLSEEVQTMLKEVQKNIHAGNQTLRALFLLEKQEQKVILKKEEMSLRDMLRNSVKNFRTILTTNEKIEEQIPPALPSVTADKELLQRVISSLLVNAWKHAKPLLREIKVSAILDLKGGVQVTISDNGEGLPVDEKENVFEKQEHIGGARLRHETGGELSFCKKLVELHGGRMCVDSSYGKGAAITFFLPLK
ncbi:MAG: response regulator [Ignavibacteria bacterium]|nr:response regulator [Ignavibacteria bacterium]